MAHDDLPVPAVELLAHRTGVEVFADSRACRAAHDQAKRW
jgi:hypothetical protein